MEAFTKDWKLIEDMRLSDKDELFFEVLVFPYPIQVSIRFEDMQMGVHSFFLILILVA